MTIAILIAELVLLYLVSRRVIRSLFTLLYSLLGSRTGAIWIVTIIFFPGTVVHELAHLFVAELLGVPTGKLSLVPESLEVSEVKAGGVMIASTDPLRRTLIGLAPVYVGIGALSVLSYFLSSSPNPYSSFFILYSLFSISNSMFSSSEDMNGVLPFTVTTALFLIAGWAAGLRIGLADTLIAKLASLTAILVQSLGLVLGLNLIVLFVNSLILVFVTPKPRA